MKNSFKFIGIIAFIAVICLIMVACPEDGGVSFKGTWSKVVAASGTTAETTHTIEATDENWTYKTKVGTTEATTKAEGTYSVDGDKVELKYTKEDGATATKTTTVTVKDDKFSLGGVEFEKK